MITWSVRETGRPSIIPPDQLRFGIFSSAIGFWFFGLPMLWVGLPLLLQLEKAMATKASASDISVVFIMVVGFF